MAILLSVLMPTFNHEKYVAQAINSVLEQKTDFDFEILINDDCSTDKTGKIIDDFAISNPKIKVFHQPKNQGLMRSYKMLVEKSIGKYLAFLETDDFYTYEFKLQEQVEFLEKNTDYGLVATSFSKINEDAIEFEVEDFKLEKNLCGNWYETLLLENNVGGVLTACVSKEKMLSCCNFDEYIKRGFKTFDYPVWLSIAANFKCMYFHKITGSYRVLSNSISNSSNYDKKKEFENSVDKIQDYIIEKFGTLNANLNDIKGMRYRRHLHIALDNKKIDDFRKYAKLYRGSSFKYKIIHYFPTLFYLQHIIRFP